MSELPEDGHVLAGLVHLVDLPLAHLVLEVGHHRGLVGSRMKQNHSHAPISNKYVHLDFS